MGHLLYLMFRCDFDVMESLESLEEFKGSKHTLSKTSTLRALARVLHVLLYMMIFFNKGISIWIDDI